MIRFKQFLFEEKETDWESIDNHYHTLMPHTQIHLDHWTGVSPHDVKHGVTSGIMQPESLEKNWKSVHKANRPIRDILRKTHGKTMTVYRGTRENGTVSHGRVGELDSYTTDRKIAERFAGSPGKRKKRHSEEDIKRYEDELKKTGRTKVGHHHLVHDEMEVGGRKIKYISLRNHHDDEITDSNGPRAEANTQNEFIDEHNGEVDAAKKRVQVRQISVDHVVHATNHMGQKEVIVKRMK